MPHIVPSMMLRAYPFEHQRPMIRTRRVALGTPIWLTADFDRDAWGEAGFTPEKNQ